MTRLAVLSDIHGNLPALLAVMQDFDSFGVDQVVVAGDVINWGPFSPEVTQIVLENHWSVVRGNNEYYLLDYQSVRMPEHWKAYKVLPWLHSQMDGHLLNFIAGWPDEISLRFPDAPPIRMFHGSPGDPWNAIFPGTPDAEAIDRLHGIAEATIIAAHSHLLTDRQIGRWHVINPGSVGVPIDGQATASYAILDGDADGWRAEHRRVAFDLDPVLAEFERQRFVEKTGVEGHLIIEEFHHCQVLLEPFNRWCAQEHPDREKTLALVEEFLRCDRLPYTPVPYQQYITPLNLPNALHGLSHTLP